MVLGPHTPVVVGVGQAMTPADAPLAPSERPEPVALMTMALRAAVEDCDGAPPGGVHAVRQRHPAVRRLAASRGPSRVALGQPRLAGGRAPGLRRGRRAVRAHAVHRRREHATSPHARRVRGHQLRSPRCRAGDRGRSDVHARVVPSRPGRGAPDLGRAPGGRAGAGEVRGREARGQRARDEPRRAPPRARLPALRERAARGERVEPRRACRPYRCPLVALQRGGGGESERLDPHRAHGAGDRDAVADATA